MGEVLAVTLEKLRATICNLGSKTLPEFTSNAFFTLVSEQSIEEGGVVVYDDLGDGLPLK